MHIVIVEDEPAILKRLQRQVSELCGDKLSVLKGFSILDDAQDYISQQAIDVLFLDLNLRGRNGFDILKALAQTSFQTVIVSAYADKALEAFEYGVTDFVAKPFTKARLKQAIDRVLESHGNRSYSAKYLSIKKSGSLSFVEIDKIDYIVAAGHYSEVVLGEQTSLHDKPIQKLTDLLPPNFEAIHRSYVINMNRVESFISEPGSKYTVKLKTGVCLPVSRTFYQKMKKTLGI